MATHAASQRGVAMVLAFITAIVLSPLYVTRKNEKSRYYETKLSSIFVHPMVLAGLIVAIRTTSSLCSSSKFSIFPASDPYWLLRVGGTSWGLVSILMMLMLVLSCQESVQEFFWR